MMTVAVRIFHSGPPRGELGELSRWLATARERLAEVHVAGFDAAGAADIRIVETGPDAPFGRRLRETVEQMRGGPDRRGVAAPGPDGLIVLGSGALPLATARDRQALVHAAAGPRGTALANNRFSADVTAIAGLPEMSSLPDRLPDNALPRWLDEVAGFEVRDLRSRWRLQADLDSPLDLVLLGGLRGAGPAAAPHPPEAVRAGPLAERLRAVGRVAADPAAELIVAGRVSSASLRWLEGAVRARTRALIEERGMKAGSVPGERASVRPPASALGRLLDHEGPAALGRILATMGEAAVVDTRVLLAHRLGSDERAWPEPEDRFASDLLLAGRIRDPWLRELTEAAASAPIPVLLGGHSLLGPGLRLVLARRGARAGAATRPVIPGGR
jgi:hypothetical protein